jgi:hypothetical protein
MLWLYYLYVSSFVLADTDRLHNKITEMSARIRQLEDALAVSHAATSSDTHTLLQRDLLRIKSIIDLHSAIEQTNEDEETTGRDDSRVLDTFGTLALRDDGASTFYGRSAGHEVRIYPGCIYRTLTCTFPEPPPGRGSLFAFS